MAESTARKHTIDILFPWALFGLLAICGLLVLILAADIYQDTTTMADENYESRTVLSYLTEKIHQNDNGTVTIGSVDGTDSLIIRQDYDGEEYCTYIFEEDGMLKELFVRSGTAVSTADGKAVIPVEDFKMEALENGLLHFSCMSEAVRSHGGQACYFLNVSRCSAPLHNDRFDFQEEALVNGVKAFCGVTAELLKA